MLSGIIVFFDITQGSYYNAVAFLAPAIGDLILLYNINSGDLNLDDSIFN